LAVYKRTDSARSWRRRLQAPIELGLALLAVAGAAAAQPSAGAKADGAATLDKFLAEVHSLTAEFRQELKTDDENLVDTGTLSFERPNRFRWMSRKPNEFIVVADGKTMWQYDVELAQITRAPLDDSNDSSPASLLAGDRNVRDRFDIVESYPRDGLEWIKLAPKAADSGFSSVLIGFDGLAPRRLELVDSLNHLTSVALEKVVLNPNLPDSEFELKAPPNVEVIGGER
jgi:outer membrane lipoprotein carrier protein